MINIFEMMSDKDIYPIIHLSVHPTIHPYVNTYIYTHTYMDTCILIYIYIYIQAFIQALLSTAKIDFFLVLTMSVNLDLQIVGKCISDTLFDFKVYVVHR